ncbi:N,N-dimethylformamidase beta subunit family domain-containing protein [Catenulispora sp. GP43]|uniref:N,N-dimethylformamidase beta subunit family domain-containing protein n=1 Tax=Catenulispora sp. GP43 TaxID=3156263 RepID=UPI00351790C1
MPLPARLMRLGLAAALVAACAADLPNQSAAYDSLGFGSGDQIALSTAGAQAGCPTGLARGWLRAENRLPGTTAWQDAKRTRAGSVNGYLDRQSVRCGDTVTAYLSSLAPVSGASLSAYRMGYYGGTEGRLVWQAKHIGLRPQPRAAVTGANLLTVAPWRPSLTFRITGRWTPGYYLLVVRAPGQTASSIPLVVRADGDRAPLGFQASVLTYQAYNTFGGHSAYTGSPRRAEASTEVSFDRPYEDGGYYSPYQYELPLVREIEKLGIDTDYFTDVDTDADPAQLKRHRGVVTGGHSEYWTKRMYDGAVAARQAGVNIAFFGANAVYTAARLTGSPLGPDRRVVIRRSVADDPLAAHDPSLATVNWSAPPLNRPEAALIGEGYGYLGANGSLRVLHPGSWLFAGTGVTAGQVLRNTVGGEYDQVDVNQPTTPPDVDVLAAIPIRFLNGRAGMATTTYYVATSQAGVFDAGTTYWPCVMSGECLHLGATPPAVRAVVARVTDNVLVAFAAGPAGLAHPSTPSWPPSAEGLVGSARAVGDVAVRAY